MTGTPYVTALAVKARGILTAPPSTEVVEAATNVAVLLEVVDLLEQSDEVLNAHRSAAPGMANENVRLRGVLTEVAEWNDSPPGNRVTLASILAKVPRS